tara:strand:+ start:150 stop:494 length:345 start_codon:yes stop_codon:yes gene_type:complete
MEEIYDEFFCGEATEEPIIQTEGAVFDSKMIRSKTYALDSITGSEMAKAKAKLDRISDVDFVRLWQTESSIFNVLEGLQDRIGCVFSGTEMLRCISRRANYLRKNGVKIQKFTL